MRHTRIFKCAKASSPVAPSCSPSARACLRACACSHEPRSVWLEAGAGPGGPGADVAALPGFPPTAGFPGIQKRRERQPGPPPSFLRQRPASAHGARREEPPSAGTSPGTKRRNKPPESLWGPHSGSFEASHLRGRFPDRLLVLAGLRLRRKTLISLPCSLFLRFCEFLSPSQWQEFTPHQTS